MPHTRQQYRLVTRSDFDGLVCATLLREKGLLKDIQFVHPKDMQDGQVAVGEQDITTNLPFVPSCHMAFDHHASEATRLRHAAPHYHHVFDPHAPSSARLVYDYYGGKVGFPRVSENLMQAVDRADSARFSREAVQSPEGWDLLSFVMDSRTGLGRYKGFERANRALMQDLIEHIVPGDADQLLQLPDVRERTQLLAQYAPQFEAQVRRCTRQHGPVAVLDLRQEEQIYPGNRFLLYTWYPDCHISIHAHYGRQRQNTELALGASIFQPRNRVNLGEICLTLGGGGHANAAACQVENKQANRLITRLIEQLRQAL